MKELNEKAPLRKNAELQPRKFLYLRLEFFVCLFSLSFVVVWGFAAVSSFHFYSLIFLIMGQTHSLRWKTPPSLLQYS